MSKQSASFKDLLAEFEAITAQFDDPGLDIERAVTLHARGSQLLDELEARLTAAEQQLDDQARD